MTSELPLGDLLEVVIDHRGKTPKKMGGTDFTDVGVPVVSAIHIKNGRVDLGQRARYVPHEMYERWMPERLRKGDVLLTSEAPLGEVAQVPSDDDLVLSQRLFALRGRAGVLDSSYLRYYFETPEGRSRIEARASGTTVIGIRQAELVKILIPVPPLDEQRRIAGVLGALDDLIETNRQLMDELRDQVSTLFRALPEPTEVRPFFEVFDVQFGGAFKGQHFTKPGTGLPLLRIRDLKTQRSDTWTTERIVGDVLVEPGDVVLGMDAEFRPTQWLGSLSLLNQRVCRIRAKGRSMAWTREALVAPMAFVEGHKTGTTVAHLNKRDMEELRVAVPPSREGERFDDEAQPLFDAVVSLSEETDDLTRVRDELLPLLMSGRVRVREVA